MIYKPTSCEPLLLTFDATQTPFFLECQIDSANTKVDAYSITLLNSDNNDMVFGHGQNENFSNTITTMSDLKDYFDNNYKTYGVGYKNLNTGLNGSFIKIPFIVNAESKALNTVGHNQLYYDEANNVFEKSSDDSQIGIFNGIGYKWRITLYQLESGNKPQTLKYYDMLVTNGTVMGSTNTRIQSAKSEKIFSDYYIQPVFISNLNVLDYSNLSKWTNVGGTITNVGHRSLIKSYDQTYGYIYPVEGADGISQDVITADEGVAERANGFQIYKRGNSPDNLTMYQKVAYVLSGNVKMQWHNTLTNPSESWGGYSYNVVDKPLTYTIKMGTQDLSFSDGSRMVLNGEGVIHANSRSIYAAKTNIPASISDYLSTTVYNINDVVRYRAAITSEYQYYKSKINNNIGNTPGQAGSEDKWEIVSYTPNSPYTNNDWYDTGITISEFNDLASYGLTWSANEIYDKFDIVIYNNVKYLSLLDCNIGIDPSDQTNNSSYWQIISGVPSLWDDATSYSANDLCLDQSQYIQSITNNQWDDQTSYNKDDIVTYNNVVYISLKNENEHHTPGAAGSDEYWAIYSGSPFNGIFYPQFTLSTIKDDNGYVKGYKVDVKLMRTPDADTWGELSNKIVYVENNNSPFYSQNIQPANLNSINSSGISFGTINKTPISFIAEQPIDIYTYTGAGIEKHHNNTGIIFYNQASSTSSGGRIYIRPFIGLAKDQVLILNSTTNIQNFIYIDNINTDYWFVSYNQLHQYNINTQDTDVPSAPSDSVDYWVTDKSRYTIRTFYRDSDENPFYFNTSPKVEVKIINPNNPSSVVPSGIVNDYNSSTTYNLNDIVIYGSQYFICRNVDNAQGAPKITSQLPIYSAFQSYAANAIVYYVGKVYQCINGVGTATPPSGDGNENWWLYQWQNYEPLISSRTIICSAKYSQNEYIQWKSAQWFLYDTDGNIIDKSDIIYDGEIKYTFTGLGGKERKKYIIELIVETYQGFKITVPQRIQTDFVIEEIESQDIISTSFDCDRLGVVSTLKFASSFVKPDNGAKTQYNYTPSNNTGTMSLDGEIIYDTITQDPTSPSPSTEKKIKTSANELEIKTSTKIRTQDFTGNILNISSFSDTQDHDTNPVSTLQLYIPDQLTVRENILSQYGIYKPESVLNSNDRFNIKLKLTNGNIDRSVRLYNNIGIAININESECRIGDRLFVAFNNTTSYSYGDIVVYSNIYYQRTDQPQTPGTEPGTYKTPDDDSTAWNAYTNITDLRDNKWNSSLNGIVGDHTYITVSEWQPVSITPDNATNYLPITYAYIVRPGCQCVHYRNISLFPTNGGANYMYIDDNTGMAYYWQNGAYVQDDEYTIFLNVDNVFNIYNTTLYNEAKSNFTIKHIQQGGVTRSNFSVNQSGDPDIFNVAEFYVADDQGQYGTNTELYIYGTTPHIFSDLEYEVKNVVYSGNDSDHTTKLLESNVMSHYNGVLNDETPQHTGTIFFDGATYQNIAENSNIIGTISINGNIVDSAYAESDDQLLVNNSVALMRQEQKRTNNTFFGQNNNSEYFNAERKNLDNKVFSIDIPMRASNDSLSVEYGTGIEPVIFITDKFVNDNV